MGKSRHRLTPPTPFVQDKPIAADDRAVRGDQVGRSVAADERDGAGGEAVGRALGSVVQFHAVEQGLGSGRRGESASCLVISPCWIQLITF